MGQEISSLKFTQYQENKFSEKLLKETQILSNWFNASAFSTSPPLCGLELEAWLVTNDFVPAPISDQFINVKNDPMVVPEISKFNFELNSDPHPISGKVFSKIENELSGRWKSCEQLAEKMGLRALIIGTLPTLRDHMLTIENLSPQKRYFAMNERIMELRKGEPIHLKIEGKDQLEVIHHDVITECAATSLQVHFGVTQENGPSYYNASIVGHTFIAALCANSPYFFGKELWDETRVTIFEQSVNLKSNSSDKKDVARVGLGSGYVKDSLMELFQENLDSYVPLLPEVMDSKESEMKHLRLQNGTIWRWTRPILGFANNGQPHLRLEFRVPSAGPSVRDGIANMAFQIAMVEYLVSIDKLIKLIPFEKAKENFYAACKFGLDAQIYWIDGQYQNLQEVLFKVVYPGALRAIEKYQIDKSDIERYLINVIEPRIKSGQNGAHWQKAFVHTHGSRFQEMLEYYYQQQMENVPVHLWKV